jgi:hypothetical protein
MVEFTKKIIIEFVSKGEAETEAFFNEKLERFIKDRLVGCLLHGHHPEKGFYLISGESVLIKNGEV